MAAPSSSDREGAPLLRSSSTSTLGPPSSNSSLRSASPRPRRTRKQTSALRAISFIWAVVSALCGGSNTVFSLYSHIFQSRLHYSQYQINGLANAMTLALYLPVPLLGYMCDRVGPGPLSLLAAITFGGGYGLAAAVYRKGIDNPTQSGGSAYLAMTVAFVGIGIGTCAIYMSSVVTCGKNFGKGKYRGMALATPISAFGLSGMWLSQVGSRVLYERGPNGEKGDVNVFHFFLFLGIMYFIVGLVGTFALRVVDEQELIDEAVEELERSGILDGSEILRRRAGASNSYGALEESQHFTSQQHVSDPAKDHEDEEVARLKKTWLLNAETRRFLSDRTLWWFALGFFLMIGPGEAFINNLGTIIGTLYSHTSSGERTKAATHVSILAFTSTAGRVLTGSLSDLLAPSPHSQHVQTGVTIASSLPLIHRKISVSRVAFLLFFAIALSLGSLALASGFIQNHGERFWIVSGLFGAGYGGIFSITPIIITVVWGVENFGTNWGIVAMVPAVASVFWGFVYSAVYQAGAKNSSPASEDSDDDVFCYGKQCYAPTFWAMTICIWVACSLVLWAWKGKGGWTKRGIVL